MRPVVFTTSPSLMDLYSPSTTAPTESLLQVQREAEDVAGELEHFAVARIGQAVDAHDAVGHGHHGAHIAGFGAPAKFWIR